MFFPGHLPELIILLIVALVIFGPKRLPEIGGAMGKGIREFKKGTSGDEADEDKSLPDSSRQSVMSAEARDREASTASRPVRDRDAS